MHQPFTLFKRKTKKKNVNIYYCQFRDTDGNRLTAQSTGKTNRGDAFDWAMQRLNDGEITRQKNVLFAVRSQIELTNYPKNLSR